MMRRGFAYILVALIICALPLAAHAAAPAIHRLESGPLPEVRPPKVRVVDLPSGTRCYLLADRTLPIVKIGAFVRTGSIYDPAGEVGLAALTALHMRIGGAGHRPPDEFDAALDDLGAELSISMKREMAALSLGVLSEDLPEGLALMFDMIFTPRFAESRLKTARKNVEESIIRGDDDPDEQAAYRFRQLVYGKDSPWARRPDKRSIRRIDVDDIRLFHENYFKANNIIITAAGDFKYDELIARLTELLSAAPKGDVKFPAVEPVELEFERRREDVIRPTSQAFIRMGHLSIKRHNPDKFALFLVDAILGGQAFKSRLMEDIRVRRGMAYSVYSAILPDTDYGLFVVGLGTSAAQADEAIDLARGHIRRMVDGDITADELAFAKRSIISRLVFLFDSPSKVVSNGARFYFYGYPDDYWRIYRKSIIAAKIGDLKRVAKEYLHPDELEIVVVGPRTKPAGKGRKR